MRFRAVAVATERSNAIGAVEVECTPAALVIVYLGVGAFSAGYAPAAITSGTRVIVPWSSVLAAKLEGSQVFLAVEPALTPHHRMSLTTFSAGHSPHPAEVRRQRVIVRIATVAAAAVALIVLAAAIQRSTPDAGPALALGIGSIAAAAILVVGFVAERFVALGGISNEAAQQVFAAELAAYLPNLARTNVPARPPRRVVHSVERFLPRTTGAIVITLSACGLGAILTASWVLRGGLSDRHGTRAVTTVREIPVDREQLSARGTADLQEPKEASPARPSAPAQEPVSNSNPPAVAGAPCTCDRGASALWAKPLPRLSMLAIAERVRQSGTRKHLEIDIAAVNNGDREIRELNVGIQFYELDAPPSNRRYPTDFRAVYFQGPLAPGQAIKWTVEEARGTEFEIQNPITDVLGPKGDGAAPQNMIATLLQANHRPVRLHGAMMLAFLADPRAKEAVLGLRDALREDEAPYLDRVLRALGDVRACDVEVRESGTTRAVSACVHNASREEKPRIALRVRALGAEVTHDEPVSAPPPLVAEATYELLGPLAAGAGVRASVTIQAPGARDIEVIADRVDLLP